MTMNPIEPISQTSNRREALSGATQHACALVPPLWTLRNFVAVNPFLGLSNQPFGQAISEIERVNHADALLRLERYWELHESGRISNIDLDEAVAAGPEALKRPNLPLDVMRKSLFEKAPRLTRVVTYSEGVDQLESSESGEWSSMIVEEIAKWCSGRFDRGQTSWPQPHSDQPIYAAWRALALVDRTPEVRGLKGFSSFVRSLPADPKDCVEQLCDELGVPDLNLTDYLARSLATISGWSGHLQYRIRQAGMEGRETDEELSDLLAIRLAYDAALFRIKSANPMFSTWPAVQEAVRRSGPILPPASAMSGLSELEIRHLWQLAFEASHRRELVARLTAPERTLRRVESEPVLQAAFCIDVRSERLRRNLESRTDLVQTIGFAGFFGLAIETVHAGEKEGEPRCPALLSPGYRIAEQGADDPVVETKKRRRNQYHSLVKQLRLSSVVAFPFVETIGQLFGLRLMTESLGWTRPGPDSRLLADPKAGTFVPEIASEDSATESLGIALEERVGIAAGILKNMGLTEGIAPYVLLCGHGSTTTNNPYSTALDCGACGGYPGDVNARAAAALLNDPAVRTALPGHGIEVPSETLFLAGFHDTTTDDIELYDAAVVPPRDLEKIRAWLGQASEATRTERAASLGAPAGAEPQSLVHQRSQDWSELRPEWGLAGNAAFIAAPRERTRGLDLEGRCFLHDYHPDRDPDHSVLELILTAPLIVASWINLQYYASTVDNEVFGSGSKTIHNVVGRHGVLAGNGGDLRVGLPFQSVHDGERYLHEPVRLTAFIEADQEALSGIIEGHEGLRELLENKWIHLIALQSDGDAAYLWTPTGFGRIDNGERQ